MPTGKQKIVQVPDLGVVAFPGTMEDDHIAAVIRATRAQKALDQQKRVQSVNPHKIPLTTEDTERARQTKQAQPLSTAIPHLPAWLNTPSTELGRQAGNWLSGEIGKALGTTLPDIDPSRLSAQEAAQFRAAHPIAGGIAHGISDVANGLTSPANTALLLTAPESKLMSAFFATQALRGSYQDAKAAAEAYRNGNNEEATKYATESVLGGAMGLAAGAHATSGVKLPAGAPRPEYLPPEEVGLAAGPEAPRTPPTIEGVTPGSAALAPFKPFMPEHDEGPIANYKMVYKSPEASQEEINDAVNTLIAARRANRPDQSNDAAQRLNQLKNAAIGQVRQLPTGENIIYLTSHGLRDLAAGLRGSAPDPNYSLNGVSIAARYLPTIARNLFTMNTPHNDELINLLIKGRGKTGDATVSAIPHKGEPLSMALSRLREELNHGWQKQYADQAGNHLYVNQYDALNREIPSAMKSYLLQMGYPQDDGDYESNRMRVLEASAKMVSGAPGEFGLTPDEVAPFLFQYFEAVTKNHGQQALDTLIHTTTLARHIKEDYANARFPNRGAENRGVVPSVPSQGIRGNQGGAQPAAAGVAPGAGGAASQPANLSQLKQEAALRAPGPDNARARLQQAREQYSALDPESVKRYEGALRDYELSTRIGMNRYLRGQMGEMQTPGDVTDVNELERMHGIPPSGATPSLKYTGAQGAQPFYLKSEKILADKMRGPMPASDIQKMLTANGVKDEEMKYTGLDDFLREKGASKVTPQEINDFLQTHDLQVTEVPKGDWSDQGRNLAVSSTLTPQQAEDFYRAQYGDQSLSPTRHSQWVMPGGQNYRELLVTLPERPLGRPSFRDSAGNLVYEDGPQGGNFISSHWREPNVVAHVRFNDRTGPNGERLLHIEELQSDPHQKARKVGYQQPAGKQQLTAKEIQPGWYEINDANGNFVTNVTGDIRSPEEAVQEAQRRLAQEPRRTSRGDAVPDFPFKKTWTELLLKRMLKYAAENGYDGITFTPGEEQADRYNLAKRIQRINYEPIGHGKTALWIEAKNGEMLQNAVNEQTDGAYWDSKRQATVVPNSALPDIVGKEVAEKIENGDGELDKEDGSRELSGLDLKVGGEGMLAYYGKIVPDALNKIAKKFGTKVGKTEIDVTPDTKDLYIIEESPEADLFAVYDRRELESPSLGEFHTEQEAKDFIAKLNREGHERLTVPYLPITPQMREGVNAEPFALFNQTRRTPPASLADLKAEAEKRKPVPVEMNQTPKDITQTPQFQQWFGQSKAVDENGKPMVMYHGSPKTFTEFKDSPQGKGHIAALGSGHYFTSDRTTAENFTYGKKAPSKAGKLYEVYLSLQNPFSVQTADADKLVDAIKGIREEHGKEPLPERVLQTYRNDVKEIKDDAAEDKPFQNEYTALDKLISIFGQDVIRKAGYDAIAFHGKGKGFNEVVVWNPKKIKSATENTGAFDPSNPDITMNQTRRTMPTETPEFKRWFGGSKIVDENGNPKVLYHSTNADWSVLDPEQLKSGSLGFHAGTKDQAEKVRETGGTSQNVNAERPLRGMNIMPVYLKMEHPLRMDDQGVWYTFEMPDRLAKLGIEDKSTPPSDDEAMRIMNWYPHMRMTWENYSNARKKFVIAARRKMIDWHKEHPDASRDEYEREDRKVKRDYIVHLIESADYDGIVYDNKYEKGGDSYMVFHPDQIKSALGNLGTFDPTNPDITMNQTRKSTPVPSISRDEAVQILGDAYANGKHAGWDSESEIKAHRDYLKRDAPQGEYVRVRVPLSDLDASHENLEREKEYAQREGQFPPIYGRYGPRAQKNGRQKIFVADGNHRVAASDLRGDTEIEVIMPRSEYEAFLNREIRTPTEEEREIEASYGSAIFRPASTLVLTIEELKREADARNPRHEPVMTLRGVAKDIDKRAPSVVP